MQQGQLLLKLSLRLFQAFGVFLESLFPLIELSGPVLEFLEQPVERRVRP